MDMERRATMVKDLTAGQVVPLLLRFALPLFVSNALQAVYNVVDMVVVGNYIGKAGMSAVSIGGDLLHLLTFVAMGFCSAGQVIIARAVGEQRPEDIQKTIGTMFSFLLSVSAGIALVCFLLRNSLLSWLNTPAAARDYAMDYLVTCVCGLVFIYGYNIVSAILRGMGDSKRPFLFIAIAAILNMILDVLFVKYFHMEVFGAALATVIGQGVSFLASLVYLYRRRESFGFDFKARSFRIDKAAFRRLVALGVPMAIQAAAVNLSKIVLMSWINLFDVTYSALAGIFNKLNTMCGVISQSFTTAGSTMVGQNLGARKYKRVNQTLLTILIIRHVHSRSGRACRGGGADRARDPELLRRGHPQSLVLADQRVRQAPVEPGRGHHRRRHQPDRARGPVRLRSPLGLLRILDGRRPGRVHAAGDRRRVLSVGQMEE